MDRLMTLAFRSDVRLKDSRREILRRAWKPGCVFCRHERHNLKWFFFWYLHEGHSQPENLIQMERSHGFCRQHTRFLLAEGTSYSVASIYSPLVSSAVESLRSTEDDISSARNTPQIAASLVSRGTCPACASQDKGRVYLSHLLQTTLHDAKVQEAVSKGSSVCLAHALEVVAEHLDWTQLRFLTGEALDKLRGGKASEVPGDQDFLMEEIWGVDLDQPYRTNGSRPEDTVDRQAYPAEPSIESTEADAVRSPTLAELRERLSERGCLVCLARQRALKGYFNWLSNEIRTEPLYKWEAALYLCREHSWEFTRRGSEEAVAMLVTSIRDYWVANLENLTGALSDKPPDRLILRAAKIPRRLRENRSPAKEQQRLTLRRELRMALEYALKSPKRILPELRGPVLRRRSCPACVYLETTANRSCDLLARGLVDPGTLQVYQRSNGLCFRHLPKALSFCSSPVELCALVRAQRARLELLQWELQEFQRKQSWMLRYEPKGVEGTAWRRAVDQYSGSEIY